MLRNAIEDLAESSINLNQAALEAIQYTLQPRNRPSTPEEIIKSRDKLTSVAQQLQIFLSAVEANMIEDSQGFNLNAYKERTYH